MIAKHTSPVQPLYVNRGCGYFPYNAQTRILKHKQLGVRKKNYVPLYLGSPTRSSPAKSTANSNAKANTGWQSLMPSKSLFCLESQMCLQTFSEIWLTIQTCQITKEDAIAVHVNR